MKLFITKLICRLTTRLLTVPKNLLVIINEKLKQESIVGIHRPPKKENHWTARLNVEKIHIPNQENIVNFIQVWWIKWLGCISLVPRKEQIDRELFRMPRTHLARLSFFIIQLMN